MERFLYRLSRCPYGNRFVLKGALMLTVWDAPLGRPTKDIDLLGHMDSSLPGLEAAIRAACLQHVEPDGLFFDPVTIRGQRTQLEAAYEGVEIRFEGSLGQARVSLLVHVGFGDAVFPPPAELDYPTILDFPAPRIRGYSRESTIAEKFEAMVKFGEVNSRLKDFYDIWLLSRQFDFAGSVLLEALTKTFASRGRQISASPTALTPTFGTDAARNRWWRAFRERSHLERAPADFAQVVEALSVFLGPLAHALVAGESFTASWPAPGPWQETL